jgi:deoxyribonuclease-4
MQIGAHVSTAGGLDQAPARAKALGCECFQIFSRSPRGGAAPELTSFLLKSFQQAMIDNQQSACYIHTPYYINLASTDERIRSNSIRIIREELDRASQLGAESVMTHLGSVKDAGEAVGRHLVVAGIKQIMKNYRGSAQFLIELSAGAGAVIGDTFEEVAEIIEQSGHDEIGVCYDTQHAFASGYDIRTPTAVKQTIDLFDHTIGLNKLRMFHVNDSMVELNAHRDRHENIGQGKIGLMGFKSLLADPRLKNCNLILETNPEGQANDIKVLKKIRNQNQSAK